MPVSRTTPNHWAVLALQEEYPLAQRSGERTRVEEHSIPASRSVVSVLLRAPASRRPVCDPQGGAGCIGQCAGPHRASD